MCKIWGVSETTQNAWINCTETENKLHLPLQRNNLCHFLGNEDYKNLKKEWHPQPVLLEENLNPELSCWAAQILGFGLKPANKSCWKCCGWGKTGPRSMPNPGSFSMFQNRNINFQAISKTMTFDRGKPLLCSLYKVGSSVTVSLHRIRVFLFALDSSLYFINWHFCCPTGNY